MLQRQYRRLTAFIILFLLALSCSEAVSGQKEVLKARLDNGLTVLIEQERSAPVVSVQMWVKVGSADEPDKLSGISHVFEHMLFKGTNKRKVGELASAVESVGGDINAFTSFDNTVYHLTVPSRYFPTGLDVISDAIQHSSFDPEELKKELEVVLEEIRMNEDKPGRNLYKSLLSNAFSVHPYRRQVIGAVEKVSALKRDEILKFFKKWYIPNNMTLVIVGDVDKNEALAAVKESFKGFKKAHDPHKKRPAEPRQKAAASEVLSMPVKESHLGMAFHIPDLKHNDTFAIDVMSIILGGGESSRLYKKLKIDDSLVYDISAYDMSLKDPGVFFITATLEAGKINDTVSGTVAEISRLASEGPGAEELEKAKFNIESHFVYSRETMDGLASKLGYYENNLGDYAYEKNYLEGIKKVSAEDVKRVIAKYFTPENMTISVLTPVEDKGRFTKEGLVTISASAFSKAGTEFVKKEAAEAKTTRVKLDNGMTLIVKEVHANPTVAFYATFPGGLRYEEAKANGAGNFTAEMLNRGTKRWTREELSKEVEEMAGAVGGFSGWNSTGVSGKFLSTHFDKGLGMLAELILNPTFPDDEVEKLRKDLIAAIIRQEDNPPSYAFKLLYKELFKEHPYGMPVIGDIDTVKALTRDDLINTHKRFFVPERMVLVIVGDVGTEHAIERVNTLFKDFTPGKAELKEPSQETRQAETRQTGAVKEKAQTNVGIGFLGTRIGSPDSYALKVLTEVLSGQGGRLFVNLRDKRSLAYSLSAFSKDGVDPGLIAVYIGTAPEKKDQAIEGILNELKEIRETKVSPEELNRAKRSLIGGYEIGLQEVSSQASDIANNELYGLGYEFYKTLPGRIEAVSADDVLEAARKYLTLDAYTISIVGPNGTETKTGNKQAAP